MGDFVEDVIFKGREKGKGWDMVKGMENVGGEVNG